MVPKKAIKAHDEKQNKVKDLRRAYEHLGRVETLQRSMQEEDEDVCRLAGLAQQAIPQGAAKDAAELLRAAEHLSFAAMSGKSAGPKLPKVLETAIEDEFQHLLQKAEEHWAKREERNEDVTAIYRRAMKGAQQAFKRSAYRQAMELARGAEALARVKSFGQHAIEPGDRRRKLATS